MESSMFLICLWLGFVTALVAGVFQSFSDFVMAGLGRATPAAAISCMQHINRTVFRSVFLTAFIALVPLTLGIAIYASLHTAGVGRVLVCAAAATYLTAVFAVTAAGNVPMNKHLAGLRPDSAEAASYWQTYRRVWTIWNHVRTIGSVASAGLFLLAAVAFG